MRIITTALLLILWQLTFAQTILNINDFRAAENDLRLLGVTEIHEQYLRLTDVRPDKAGGCWYAKEKIDLRRGFETEFEFRVNGQDEKSGGGDGFAFVLQNHGEAALGGSGDDIGYKGLTNAIALEFDTYNNKEGSRNHINIAYYDPEKGAFRRHATVHEIPEISDGEPHFARIHYKDGYLTLFMDSYIFPVISSKLDLTKIISSADSTAWVGFTSATSEAFANHDLIKWQLNYYLPPPEIKEEEVNVSVNHTIIVHDRKVKIHVWDHNKIDGDIVSLKLGENWILTDHRLTKQKHTIEFTLTGFSNQIIMFANNIGSVPPNTASISIDDGIDEHVIKLQADLESSEAIEVRYEAPATEE
jgi:hypothetical protein